MDIRIKKLHPDAVVPKYSHNGDAGCDLACVEDIFLKPGERTLAPTGLAVAIPEGYAAFIQPRSGLAIKHGISINNSPGLIDSHYRGEIKVILINHDWAEFKIEKGERICQMVIQKVEEASFTEVKELDETERGKGGFGSTGSYSS
jgi:dUTP pyrophosphatase